MRFAGIARRLVPLTAGLLIAVMPARLAWSQEAPAPAAMIGSLSGLEAPYDIDIPALRLQAAERLKSKADAPPLKRAVLVPQLNRLPHLNLDIQFNPDSPVIRP
jgi:OmpA-OmpF porin, OOP family